MSDITKYFKPTNSNRKRKVEDDVAPQTIASLNEGEEKSRNTEPSTKKQKAETLLTSSSEALSLSSSSSSSTSSSSPITDENWPDHLEELIPSNWREILKDEFSKPYWKKLCESLKKEVAAKKTIFPHYKNIFRALELCPFDDVKVVLIGQDPYHDNGQAEGLCFSVPKGVAVPSSLRNVYKELQDDVGFVPPKHGHLVEWAQQGILLLNITLTVRAHEAASHKSFGWHNFTEAIIKQLSQRHSSGGNIVFLLWGKHAQEKAKFIDKKKHLVLQCAHPSGLSAHRGFFGCRHFSKTNKYLKENGRDEIDWQLSS